MTQLIVPLSPAVQCQQALLIFSLPSLPFVVTLWLETPNATCHYQINLLYLEKMNSSLARLDKMLVSSFHTVKPVNAALR